MSDIHFIQDLAVILTVAGVVGWACQRAGLSVVVGFLVAGILLGPKTTALALISDQGTIQTLAELGLVFLMFSIGLKLSLRKLRRLGMPLMAATLGGAVLMYYLSRLLGAALGWSSVESSFLAGMLMVSSSAIISKILHETGANHERAGQMAMGISVLEDVVAVVMLTLLSSFVHVGGSAGGAGLGETLLTLGAFVVLTGVAGLLLVPWLLKRLSMSVDEGLQTLALAALVFGLAVLAMRAGYSLALGAFLLGAIVAETPHRHQVERTFEGMRDVFSAVFFVAIGMQIDVRVLWAEAGLIAGVAAFTLVARPLAIAGGLLIVGTRPKDAVRTGLTVTPIGEFSFIIAQLGVGAAVVPAKFYPLAVGVSLVTALVAPVLTRHSGRITAYGRGRQPRWLADWLMVYRGWLDDFRLQRKLNTLWQLSRTRLVQVGVEMLLVTGLLVFSQQLYAAVSAWVGGAGLFPNAPRVLFGSLLGLVLLASLMAIWRNCSALALLFAQVSTSGHPRARKRAPVVEGALKGLAGGLLFLWLAVILPTEGMTRWVLLSSALIAVGALVVLRRKLIYWHSHLEVGLQSVVAGGERMSPTVAPWLQPHGDWNLRMIDCTLPDLADCQGRKISELELRTRFGCSVVGIERQGFMIPLPSPDAALYPRDKVLLLGTSEQVKAGREFLGAVSGGPAADSLYEELRMEVLAVPPGSRAEGRTLEELAPTKNHAVQIAGVHRGGLRVLNPGAGETVRAGDELLALGMPARLGTFKEWLQEDTALVTEPG